MKILFIRKKYFVPIVVVIILALVSLNVILAENYVLQVSGDFREDIPIYSVDCEGKKCAITFDCDLFRPPYGEYNSTTVTVAKNLGYQTIQWDVDSLDIKVKT